MQLQGLWDLSKVQLVASVAPLVFFFSGIGHGRGKYVYSLLWLYLQLGYTSSTKTIISRWLHDSSSEKNITTTHHSTQSGFIDSYDVPQGNSKKLIQMDHAGRLNFWIVGGVWIQVGIDRDHGGLYVRYDTKLVLLWNVSGFGCQKLNSFHRRWKWTERTEAFRDMQEGLLKIEDFSAWPQVVQGWLTQVKSTGHQVTEDMKIIGCFYRLEGYFGLEVFTESFHVRHRSGSKVTYCRGNYHLRSLILNMLKIWKGFFLLDYVPKKDT